LADKAMSTLSLQQYTIKQGSFEGPLHILLELIESRKLFVNDIALASVTEDFIVYVESIRTPESGYPLALQSEFVMIASTLLLIKSKSLLPGLALTEEEQSSVTDLELRLKLLQIFKQASQALGAISNKTPLFEAQESSSKERYAGFIADPSVTEASLLEALQTVLMRAPQQALASPRVTVEKVVTLEEMMARLADRINNAIKMTFTQFSGNNANTPKKEVIVGFLALLELVKRGVLIAKQGADFEEIHLEKEQVDVPRYA
jgi:segregation and condensation protein A